MSYNNKAYMGGEMAKSKPLDVGTCMQQGAIGHHENDGDFENHMQQGRGHSVNQKNENVGHLMNQGSLSNRNKKSRG